MGSGENVGNEVVVVKEQERCERKALLRAPTVKV